MDPSLSLNKEYEETISKIKDLKEGSIISGKIVHVSNEEILVDIGYKSEGVIPASDFLKKDKKIVHELKNGDDINVFVLNREDESGRMLLSYRKALLILSWKKILNAFESGESMEAEITEPCKNSKGRIAGFTVDVDGIKGFMPLSECDIEKPEDPKHYIGKKFEVKIIELDKNKNDVVFSQKLISNEKKKKQKEILFKSLKKGEVLEGTVRTLTQFGAFVDIGGVDGLVHIKELSWGRKKPEEILKVGEKIKVKVLDFNKEDGKIALGLKQLKPDPWDKVEDKYPVGTKVKAKVVKMAAFGVFVELEEGIEGLVRLEDLSWKRMLKHPSEVTKEGETLEFVVTSLNKEDKKLALSLKQILPDPWILSSEKYYTGMKVKGKIVKLTAFGAFVRLEEGIDGLIKLKDLSWMDNVKHPAEVFSKNREIEAVVLKVDRENKRISLGTKQLSVSPWDKFKKGAIVEGKVIKMDDFGAAIQLENNIEGFVHVSELSNNYVNKPSEVIAMDQLLTLKVLDVNPKQKKIELSLKKYIKDQEKGEVSHFINSQEKDTLTLGDLMAHLKTKK